MIKKEKKNFRKMFIHVVADLVSLSSYIIESIKRDKMFGKPRSLSLNLSRKSFPNLFNKFNKT